MPNPLRRALAGSLAAAVTLQSSPALAGPNVAPTGNLGAVVELRVAPTGRDDAASRDAAGLLGDGPLSDGLSSLTGPADSDVVPAPRDEAPAPTALSGPEAPPVGPSLLVLAGQPQISLPAVVPLATVPARDGALGEARSFRSEDGRTQDADGEADFKKTRLGAGIVATAESDYFAKRGASGPDVEFGDGAASAGSNGSGLAGAGTVQDGSGGGRVPVAPRVGGRFYGELPLPLWLLLGNLVLTSLWLEGMALAGPQLAGILTSDWFGMSLFASVASIALLWGSRLSARLNEGLGLNLAYIVSLLGRVAAIGTLAFLLANGLVGAWGFIALFSIGYVFHASGKTTEMLLAPHHLGKEDAAKLTRFNALRQLVVNGVGFVGPVAASLLIAAVGYPLTLAAIAGLTVLALLGPVLVGLDGKPKPKAAGAQDARPYTFGDAAREIWSNPAMRTAGFVYAAFIALVMVLYFLIAPAYGWYVAGEVSDVSRDATANMKSLFAGGTLLGSLMLRRVKNKDHKRTASWMTYAGLGLLAFWGMLLTPSVHLLITLRPAHALIAVFGFLSALVFSGLYAVIQKEASDRGQAKIHSLVSMASYTMALAMSIGVGLLFHFQSYGKVPTFLGMLILNLGLTALAALVLWAGHTLRRFARAATPEPKP